MLIATTEGIAGRRIVATLGLVLGLAVRSRGLGGNIMAGFHALGHGDALGEFGEALAGARQEAIARMAARALELGANAIVGARFDAAAAGHDMGEIVAYGTAVVVAPDDAPPRSRPLATPDDPFDPRSRGRGPARPPSGAREHKPDSDAHNTVPGLGGPGGEKGAVMNEERGGTPGYDYGAQQIARSPLTLEDLELLEQTVLFTEEDGRYLRMAGDVLEPQVDEILDVWYGFVGAHPHLIHYFADAGSDQPNAEYLGRVRERFKRWILDTCRRPYDQAWLDYHYEIALRHTHAKKNRTDGADKTPDHIGLRYMIAFVYPITATIKPFLDKGGRPAGEVGKMHDAWFKSVTLQVTLWSLPYAKEGDF